MDKLTKLNAAVEARMAKLEAKKAVATVEVKVTPIGEGFELTILLDHILAYSDDSFETKADAEAFAKTWLEHKGLKK